MKTSLKIFLSLFATGILFFTSCKKNDGALPENPPGTLLLTNDAGRTSEATSARSEPTATITLSEDIFNALVEGKLASGERTGDHSYRAIQVIDQPGGGGDPEIDPCARDWMDFHNWYNSVYPQLQAWANANCKPAYFAWSGTRCLACVIGMVKPNNPRNCMEIAVYSEIVAAFE